jgi:predicted phage baseplate assembly protein
MLLSRPLGLTEARNPLASAGAGDPEKLDAARSNAPVTVRTMDRIVSLDDFADFARASAGIAKASVTWLWDGTRTLACVTVAGTDGAPVVVGSAQFVNLLQAMRSAGDGTVPVVLCNAVPVAFEVAATVTLDPTLVPATVLDAVKAALRQTFGFDARRFGEPVYRSQVIECIQDVPGVVAMTLDRFGYSGSPAAAPPEVLVASAPTVSGGTVVGAQLLTIDTGPLPGVVVAP